MKKVIAFISVIVVFLIIFFLLKIQPTYFPFTKMGKPTELNMNTYMEDLEFLNRVIKEHHPFLEVANDNYNIDWDKEYNYTKEKMANITDIKEFEKTIEELLSKLQNGHTQIIKDSDELAFFYYFYSQSGNIYDRQMIKRIRNTNTIARYNLKNSQIKEFNENGPKKFYEKRTYDNFNSKILIPDTVAYAHVRTMLSESDKDYYTKDVKSIDEFIIECKDYPIFILDIRGNGGGSSNYWIDLLLPKLIEKENSLKYSLFLKDGFLYPISLKNKYSNLKTSNSQKTYLKNYSESTKEIINNFQLVRNSKISVWPSTDDHFTGNLYLLIDKNVYSSSETLAVFCKKTKSAVLVGEKTGGDGIGSGLYFVALPNSGLVISFPLNLGILEDGSINEIDKTVPDYTIENATKDKHHDLWDYKKDPCIKKIFELEKIDMFFK